MPPSRRKRLRKEHLGLLQRPLRVGSCRPRAAGRGTPRSNPRVRPNCAGAQLVSRLRATDVAGAPPWSTRCTPATGASAAIYWQQGDVIALRASGLSRNGHAHLASRRWAAMREFCSRGTLPPLAGYPGILQPRRTASRLCAAPSGGIIVAEPHRLCALGSVPCHAGVTETSGEIKKCAH